MFVLVVWECRAKDVCRVMVKGERSMSGTEGNIWCGVVLGIRNFRRFDWGNLPIIL